MQWLEEHLRSAKVSTSSPGHGGGGHVAIELSPSFELFEELYRRVQNWFEMYPVKKRLTSVKLPARRMPRRGRGGVGTWRMRKCTVVPLMHDERMSQAGIDGSSRPLAK
jgi:hypothetical protein